jgi:hypothetical protein
MSFTGTQGLQHISKSLDGRDIESLQRMLVRVGRSLPDTTINHERKVMAEHKEMPGKGVMFYEEKAKRKSEKGPDYKGFLVLEMDYKAGDKLKLSAWEKPTSMGYSLLSLAEDNWARKQKETPREVRSGYQRRENNDYAYRPKDSDVPF